MVANIISPPPPPPRVHDWYPKIRLTSTNKKQYIFNFNVPKYDDHNTQQDQENGKGTHPCPQRDDLING